MQEFGARCQPGDYVIFILGGGTYHVNVTKVSKTLLVGDWGYSAQTRISRGGNFMLNGDVVEVIKEGSGGLELAEAIRTFSALA